MTSLKDLKILMLALGMSSQVIILTPKVFAGSFGAQIFCTMRDGGNDHESSWEAAYSYIKRQKGGFFKTSPTQAAAQIIETVVRERDKFSYCIEYLNKLYPDRQLQRKVKEEEDRLKKEELEKENRRKKIDRLIEEEESLSEDTFDRYSY
tara:strand:- start:168 stop:617 length:450 start_codon:yes stop_codon:yes gene_type:complete